MLDSNTTARYVRRSARGGTEVKGVSRGELSLVGWIGKEVRGEMEEKVGSGGRWGLMVRSEWGGGERVSGKILEIMGGRGGVEEVFSGGRWRVAWGGGIAEMSEREWL